MNLYLVRHGETEWNRLKKFQGQQDSDLTETGVEQAKKLGKYLKKENIVIDYLYSSPQKRAYETAELLDCNENIIKELNHMASFVLDNEKIYPNIKRIIEVKGK